MIDRLISAITCGLALGMLFGLLHDPAAAWPFWVAVAIVALNLAALALRRPGFRRLLKREGPPGRSG